MSTSPVREYDGALPRKSTRMALDIPILPHGMSFKVKRPDVMFGFVKIQLRERTRWKFNYVLAEVVVFPSEYATAEAAIEWGCHEVIERHERRSRNQKIIRGAAKLSGVYKSGCTCTPVRGKMDKKLNTWTTKVAAM